MNAVKNQNLSNGITLIALVITIIVLLILAGVSIATLTGDSGIITKAEEAKLSTELSQYKEELELYKINKYSENGNFEETTLMAGKTELNYNTKENEETGNIKTVIPDISDEYFEKLEIIKGELLINTQDKAEIRVAQSLGIEVNPYDIRDGVLWSSNGNLLLMDENTGSLTIPDSVTAIGEGAFSNLDGLKTIIIPSTVKRIEKNAFRNNSTLETVIMQEKVNSDGLIEGVEYIGVSAFQECENLNTVQMPNSVTQIGSQAFYYDTKLQNINISKKIKKINSYIFYGCRSLETVEIPEGVISIELNAFSNCGNLETIKLPSTLESIDSTAFNACTKLNNIEIPEGNNNFKFVDGILLGDQGRKMVIILESAVKGDTFTIPDTVTELGASQITQYTNIIKVEIPASVTKIDSMFISNNITEVIIDSGNAKYETDGKAIYTKDDINNIQLIRYYGNESDVKIEKQIKELGIQAFYNRKNLVNIELPETLETISSQAFSGCSNLKSIKLGKNIKGFDNMSIYGSGIERIEIDENNPNYSIRKGAICNGEEVDALYNKDGSIFISPIKPTGTIITYEIKEKVDETKVKEINNYAFHNQNKMTSIKLPDTIEKIGNSFNYCTELTNIEIPSSVKEISSRCFAEATNLKEIIVHKKNDGTLTGSPWGCIYGDKAIIWEE